MKYKKNLFFILCTVLVLGGCGIKKPDGIPDLHPAKVVVTDGGTPIRGATVSFRPTGSGGSASGSWNTVALTDASGVAMIATSQGEWKADGVPAGEYRVVISKKSDYVSEPIPPEIEGDEQAKMAFYAEQKKKMEAAASEVPKSLGASESPLKITVSPGTPAELTVDVAQYK